MPKFLFPVSRVAVPAFLAFSAIVASLGVAQAREATADEQKALADTVKNFETAIGADDFDGILSVMPPKLMSLIAQQSGTDEATVRGAMKQQMQEAMKAVQFESYGMDVPATDYEETPDGEPYALIPTEMVMRSPQMGTVQVSADTLGLLDEGKWYLVRVSEPQMIDMLRQVYPQFAEVTFPEAKTTNLK